MISAITADIRVVRYESGVVRHAPSPWHTLLRLDAASPRLLVDGMSLRPESYTVYFLSRFRHWQLEATAQPSLPALAVEFSEDVFREQLPQDMILANPGSLRDGVVPSVRPAPLIAQRLDQIMVMIDELLCSPMSRKEEAALSLLQAFFVYCDSMCNLHCEAVALSPQADLVNRFYNLVGDQCGSWHSVTQYARELGVSSSHLNACTTEHLGRSAKNLIDSQIMLAARRELKFTADSIKDISKRLGFSSPDYFSVFFRRHTGVTPRSYREPHVSDL